MITIIKKELLSKRVEKIFELLLPFGQTLKLNKWWIQDDISGDYETDYKLDEDSQKVFDGLSEKAQEKVNDFIDELE